MNIRWILTKKQDLLPSFQTIALSLINFDWKDVKILDIEPSYNKKLIPDIVHIKKQYQGLNR